jgi:dTDP-glucose pyrophosphorylase
LKAWERALIGPEATLRDALAAIDAARCQIALVVDTQRRLLGTLSDGDARRALLRGLGLSDRATLAMHGSPTYARVGDDRHSILSTMRRLGLHQVPLLDADGVVVGLQTVDDYLAAPPRDNWVVIMAGGLGTRLRELTDATPKPMLRIGSRPLLETIVRSFGEQGFRQFWLAVNYKADQIEAHFGDGSAMKVEIRYLREQERMGTAGALSLLPEMPQQPLIVTNGDLLTKEDYGRMVDLHDQSGADATMAVRDYQMQVPFGVVHARHGRIDSIDEKPIQRFVVSAGMYVLSQPALKLVPPNQYFDMPSLFKAMVTRGMHTRCHNVDGYWLDIGRMPDYLRANVDFPEVFG